MSAPRWTLTGFSLQERIIRRDGEQALLLRPAGTVDIPELTSLARRIVALLNATELSSDAVAKLQTAMMDARAGSAVMVEQQRGFASLENVRLRDLDRLTDVLNHAVRVYVELDEEPSVKLDGGK